MSKELATFDTAAFALDELDDELYGVEEGSAQDIAEVTGGSTLRLGCKKDRFQTTLGKDVLQKFKKGEAVPVVVHAFAPGLTQRQYFPDKYVEGQAFKPPICWSDDGNVPDPKIERPQGKKCSTCPHGTEGSKECSFTSKLVVSFPAEKGGDNPVLMDMNINSGTLFSKEESFGKDGLGYNWINYVKWWKEEAKKNMSRFITMISINVDNEKEHENQLLFRPMPKPLTPKHPNWLLHDEQDAEDLLKRVELNYSDMKVGDDMKDEEEEDTPPPAKKKRASKKTAAKKKPDPVEEEEDEEEEEAPPAKKRSSKKTAAKKKAEPVEEDDDDEEDEDLDDDDVAALLGSLEDDDGDEEE